MRTIIGVLPFHGPVRDGKEWDRQAVVVRRRGQLTVVSQGASPSCRSHRLRRAVTDNCQLPTVNWKARMGLSGIGDQAGARCLSPAACCLFPERAQGYGIKPHGRLVPVSSTRCRASTSGLSTWWSATTLQGGLAPGRSHLQACFPLRCFQRLSLPHIATRRCDWRHNRYTSGASTPVLSY